jgi:predicted transcriptional regulator
MASDTVRIKPETHAKLREIAQASGQSMPDVLEQAVESLRRARLLDESNRAYAALRDDPKAWKAELAERKSWEVTLGDDLEDK